MLMTTTNTVEGRPVREYLGVVTGESILGANIGRDIGAMFRNVTGGRVSGYEKELRNARDIALQEMEQAAATLGADAIIGIDIDYGLDVAGWGSDYCGPTTPPRQYLWLQDASGAYGFYQNYSGRAKGSCTGTRNHVRLWSLYSGIAGGQLFSVGTAHREVWDWLDFNHHVVPNGWHIARDAMLSDHPAPGGYYYWGNWGYYGSGGYFGGSVAELGCYSPYPCY